jgi:hypothetical protein
LTCKMDAAKRAVAALTNNVGVAECEIDVLRRVLDVSKSVTVKRARLGAREGSDEVAQQLLDWVRVRVKHAMCCSTFRA